MEQFGNPIAPQFSVRQFLLKYLFLVPWLIVTISISIAYNYTKLRYINPVYVANGKVLIKVENSPGSSGSGDKLGDIVTKQVNARSMDDQIELIRSTALARLVNRRVGLQQSYYYKGDVRNTLIHNQESPVQLQIISITDSSYGFSIEVFPLDKDHFRINRETTRIKFGEIFQTQLGSFILHKSVESFAPDAAFICNWSPEIDVARGLAASIQAATVTKSSNVLNFVYYSENPRVAEDVVNGFLQAYQDYSLNDKRESSSNALSFIDAQLEQARAELGNVETKLQNFKESTKVVGIDQQSSEFYNQMKEANSQMQEQAVKVKMIDLLINYVKDPKNAQKSIPLALGFTDPAVSGFVTEYNKMLLQREISLKTIPKDNPIIKDLDKTLAIQRNEILLSLNQVKDGYKAILNNMQDAELVANVELKSLPKKTRDLIDITRQQKVAEDLYSSLLQRKIQTSISAASTLSNIQILEPGFSNGAPVSPNPRSMYISGILVALALPIGLIALLELMNEKVRKREDVEKATKTPILGEVGHSEEQKVLLITHTNRKFIAEQFRIMRSNLQYFLNRKEKPTIMVTSGVSGEGKTFVSINLAAVHAVTGKKTVVLEFDIRKPRLISDLQMKSSGHPGITNFLMGKANLEEIIRPVEEVENMFVIGCGPVPPNPAELILNDRLKTLFDHLKEKFEVVIIDTAPIGLVSDAFELSKYVDASLFVIRHNHTMKTELALVEDVYSSEKLPKMSVVINDVQAIAGYGKYYGYSGYGYGYGYGYVEKLKSGYFQPDDAKRTWKGKLKELFGL